VGVAVRSLLPRLEMLSNLALEEDVDNLQPAVYTLLLNQPTLDLRL
jgi:hypothetical protein